MSPNSEEQVATETVTEQPEVQQPEPSQPDPIQPEPTQPDPVTPDPNGPTPDPEDPDYVDPNEVAETLTQEIDTEDIDDDLVFTPDNYGEAYMPDGTRQFAVFGHLPDGSQVALLDIDGDGIFGDFFDAEGNLIGQIDEGLSVSDILDMADETGGYLAGLNEPWEDEGVSEGVSSELELAAVLITEKASSTNDNPHTLADALRDLISFSQSPDLYHISKVNHLLIQML